MLVDLWLMPQDSRRNFLGTAATAATALAGTQVLGHGFPGDFAGMFVDVQVRRR